MRHSYAIGLLILLILIVFGQTATFDFVEYDDHTYLINNPHFHGGMTLENIKWSFTTGYFVNWHPVTWLSFFLDNQLYAMDARGYHITNVIFHILAAILLYLALFKMTAKRTESLIVAILFAIHPQHVQSVAWVSERKDVLSALFMGLTLLAYHRYTQSRLLRWYVATALAFALGLMSKPMLVTLPCVLLLLDHWPLNRLNTKAEIRRAVLEKLPLLAMAVASSIITLLVQSSGGAVSTIEGMGFTARIATAALAYGMYLLHTIWPVNLTFFYPLIISEIPYPAAALSGAILILISILIWRFRKKTPALAVGWLWYLGTLLPVIGLIQVGGQAYADRYTYIPLTGVFIAVVYTIHPWLQHTPARQRASRYVYLALLVSCLFVSFKETYFWKDTATLAGRGLVVRKDNHLAHQMLGNFYFNQGDMQRAEEFYRSYFELNPNDANVQLRLASVLQEQRKYDEAEEMLRTCIEFFPENAAAHFNMGLVFAARNNVDEAMNWYAKAIGFDDPEPRFHINFANLLAQSGDLDLALQHYDSALQLDPRNLSAHYNQASALFFHHRLTEALEFISKCLEIDPQYEPGQLLLQAINEEVESQK